MTTDDDFGMALVGINREGNVTAALGLQYATKKEVREFYRDMADSGRTIERTTVEDARERLSRTL